ncbi:thermonuclease family protein [Methylobacterium brachiatum]|uniref:thermonuclease family protein n=1 Tax=Methylobacterium brachiatum TaxID=269660 RepID=UPI00142899D1|nr:thermonuclease family protein [Methylobacterium brachiatum]
MTSARSETLDGTRIIILDGDTVALPCVVVTRGCAEKIRFTAIDAPKVFHPSCDAELQAGLRAKERVAQLARGNPVEVVRTGATGRYGRTLGDLSVRAGIVGTILAREGLALPYQPGREEKEGRTRHWCR